MELYDLTLKKEVARECAWGVKCKFLMGIFSEMEEI